MKAKMFLTPDFTIGKIDDRLYGAFVEHMGRAVYHGIYEPSHPQADENGFRRDVIRLVEKMNIPIIRYPGGNFVSNYNWEDGIGPKDKRPKTLDAAWHSVEPNEIGIDEFCEWARRTGSSVMMALNLGTRGLEDAKNLLEYCNFPAGTKYADMRVKNGHKAPHSLKVWCLGNEMDGEWQVGQRTPENYADIARRIALLFKRMDPTLELVACGSASWYMPAFGKWEFAVLESAYEWIDYISLHLYLFNQENDTLSYLGSARDMDSYIKTVAAACDFVKGLKHSKKDVRLSFDEWNVWSAKRKCNNNEEMWTIAPRREEYIYSLEDALVFGCMLITLINNCDRVKIACLAQLVNVAAPIMTVNNGIAWAQTTYYPFVHASNFGRGTALQAKVICDAYDTEKYGAVPFIETAAVLSDNKSSLTIFAVNRSLNDSIDLELDLKDFPGFTVLNHIVLEHEDTDSCNTAENPFNVIPHENGMTFMHDRKAIIKLSKHSWNVIRLAKT